MVALKLWVKLVLFISSFSPLILIWAIKLQKINKYSLLIAISIIIISSLILLLVLEKARRGNNPDKIKINSIEDLNSSHIEYLLAYVFAFLPFGEGSVATFFIFISVLVIVYLKSNLLYVNPLLVVFGYSILKIKDNNENSLILITRKSSHINNTKINLSILNGNIFVESKR
ncbi:hypothetical protein KAS08_03740 [Candidatus Pacearchaeota archaeon]|nr:hypothetical protein [Candidatus Pacearchaeota archaeon]